MMRFILCLFTGWMLLQCATPKTSTSSTAELDRLVRYMSGTFDSAEQAAADSAYYHISLRMAPIWPERTDGRWLYVEQAVANMADRPYRQRVYRVEQTGPKSFASHVYTLDEPREFVGAYAPGEARQALTFDRIALKDGCAVLLEKQANGTYRGQTGTGTCASNLRGAQYAHSEVAVYKGQLISWDRGYDENGKQVWGAEKGGYVFVKRE